MRVVDLSHRVEPKMTVFPGTEEPSIEQICTIAQHGFQETQFTIASHVGTHIDAPAHMLKEGKGLEQFPVETFFGRGTAIDCRAYGGERVPLAYLQSFEPLIQQVDFVLLQTGWSRWWKQEQYFLGYATLSLEAAQWLVKFPLKGIGIDAISMDAMEDKDFPLHHLFLGHHWILIENLNNLEEIQRPTFHFSCLPLHYPQADGSPVRAVAIEDL